MEENSISIPTALLFKSAPKPKKPVQRAPAKPSSGKSPLGIQLPSAKSSVQNPETTNQNNCRSEPDPVPIDPATVVILPQTSKLSDSQVRELLEMAEKKPLQQQLREAYEKLARFYLNEQYLVVGDVRCRILEVEFFFSSDPYFDLDGSFPRGFDEQILEDGQFYLHRIYHSRTETVTISKREKRALYVKIGDLQAPGLMLIRSLERLDLPKREDIVEIQEKKEPILAEITQPKKNVGIFEGAHLVIDFVAKELGRTLDELGADFLSGQERVRFIPALHEDDSKIYSGPRLGLDVRNRLRNLQLMSRYIMQPFRFVVCPEKLQDGKPYLALQAQLDGVPDDSIKKDLGLTGDILGLWRSLFFRGQSSQHFYFVDQSYAQTSETKNQILAFGFFSQFLDWMREPF